MHMTFSLIYQWLRVDLSVLLGAENLPAFIKLRALDSIHMATALSIKNEIEGVVTYDKEIIESCRNRLGLKRYLQVHKTLAGR
jgi:predicted nucleic acid-binding protein